MAHSRIGENCDVLAWPHYLRLIEGADIIAFWDVFGEIIKKNMLKEQHRVVVPDGGLHQSLGICRRADCHNFDAWHRVEVGLQALAVLSPQLTAHTPRTSYNCGDGVIAAACIAEHPHVIGYLVKGKQ